MEERRRPRSWAIACVPRFVALVHFVCITNASGLAFSGSRPQSLADALRELAGFGEKHKTELKVHVRRFDPPQRMEGKFKLPALEHLNLVTEGGIFGQRLCTGHGSFVTDLAAAPLNFCMHANAQPNMTLAMSIPGQIVDFDQFALERVMLGRWLEAERRQCGTAKPCENADVVVVPSLALQKMLMQGFKWPVVKDEIPQIIRRYWDAVRAELYQPEKNYTPIVVLHQPFTFVRPQSVDMIRALLEQPAGFVNRVVIGAIESNMRPEVRQAVKMPAEWQDDAQLELFRRASSKSDNSKGTPLIVTLPYPTPILRPISFLKDHGNFRFEQPRRIAVLMSANPTKGAGPNWIRPLLIKAMHKHTGADTGVICSPESPDRRHDKYCGLVHKERTMWDLLVNSAFCVEPPGDTLTRSHFYLAVLTGCIPVLFEGGHNQYPDEELTAWAWRSHGDTPEAPFIDYNDFTVTFNANDVKEGKVNWVHDLVTMPKKHPKRFNKLRAALEKVAPQMRYAGKDCGDACGDAFEAFESIVYAQANRG